MLTIRISTHTLGKLPRKTVGGTRRNPRCGWTQMEQILKIDVKRGCSHGGVAQLGERSVRNAEVVGSIPIVSILGKHLRLMGGKFR